MATMMQSLMFGAVGQLRVQPVAQRVRAISGGEVIVDSSAARLIWEPRRVVGSYAVPRSDIAGELVAWAGDRADERPVRIGDGPPMLDPSSAFSVHTADGTGWTIRTAGRELLGAAFTTADPDLEGYVLLDWTAFDSWFDEDEPRLAHPRDPFQRIDCLRSSRHVEVRVDGQILADSSRPTLLLETNLPVRYYLPADDVRLDLLAPTTTHTACAYKGVASYWSSTGEHPVADVCWSYPEPLHDALPVAGMYCFFGERVELSVDGAIQSRPVTPWS
ncbi:DUF427 domain-containing protein [Nakamurella lactea]|uniref:DUF427 domain-containing protein n=1 Tax=Nakamurella lactea TaxID=459515 RepID=UPI000414335A|nr:DUF427 domain-containing protein [Nakamurella lactea]